MDVTTNSYKCITIFLRAKRTYCFYEIAGAVAKGKSSPSPVVFTPENAVDPPESSIGESCTVEHYISSSTME